MPTITLPVARHSKLLEASLRHRVAAFARGLSLHQAPSPLGRAPPRHHRAACPLKHGVLPLRCNKIPPPCTARVPRVLGISPWYHLSRRVRNPAKQAPSRVGPMLTRAAADIRQGLASIPPHMVPCPSPPVNNATPHALARPLGSL